jgi:hypothetical protein
VPDSVTARTATPNGSASTAPTAGEPADLPSTDRYWRTHVDRAVLFNVPATPAVEHLRVGVEPGRVEVERKE